MFSLGWISQLGRGELYFVLFIILMEMSVMLFWTAVYAIKSHERMASVEEVLANVVELERIRAMNTTRGGEEPALLETQKRSTLNILKEEEEVVPEAEEIGVLSVLKEEEKLASEKKLDIGKIAERVVFQKQDISAKILPLDIDVVNTQSIQDSMEAISRKYSLGSITITSEDGVVIASSLEKAEGEAAEFSFMFQETQKIRQTNLISLVEVGVYIYSIESIDGPIICVIRCQDSLDSQRIKKVGEDVKGVLKYWFDIDVAQIR